MAEDFIHRIGRTARAGKEGCALTFLTPNDKQMWKEIQRLINPNMHSEFNGPEKFNYRKNKKFSRFGKHKKIIKKWGRKPPKVTPRTMSEKKHKNKRLYSVLFVELGSKMESRWLSLFPAIPRWRLMGHLWRLNLFFNTNSAAKVLPKRPQGGKSYSKRDRKVINMCPRWSGILKKVSKKNPN